MNEDIKIIVEVPKGKEQEVKVVEGKKLLDIQAFPERFWTKNRTYKRFLDFILEYKEVNAKEMKLTLEEQWKDHKKKRNITKEVPKNIPQKYLNILRDPNILELYNGEFEKRIVKEQDTRKTIFIFSNGRLLKNAEPTSFNLCASDESGLGKDYVVDNVLKIFEKGEDKDYIKCEKTTPETLDVLSKKIDWTNKIFYNADIRESVLNSNTFKVFSSGAELFYSYKDGFVNTTNIIGKPVMIVTTAKASSNEELTRRYVNCKLTDDVNQTKEIMKRWAKFKARGVKPEYCPFMRGALKYLKPIKVSIPFAEQLVNYFPSEHHIMRTQWPRFLDIIGAVTVLYQYQREVNEQEFYLATWEDYDIAVDILKHLLDNSKQIPLSKTDKKIIQALRTCGNRVRISTLETNTHFTAKTIRERLMQLADFGLVMVNEANHEEREKWNLKKPTMVFTLVELSTIDIPKSNDIKNKSINVSKNYENEGNNKKSNNNNNIKNNTFNNINNNIIKKTSLKFLESVPEAFVGEDMKAYGPFEIGDIAKIPERVANILVKREIAKKMEEKHK